MCVEIVPSIPGLFFWGEGLLEGELGLVGFFGDGGGQGLFLDGTAEEENYFFEHDENSLIFCSVYSILHASGQFVSSLVTEMKKY